MGKQLQHYVPQCYLEGFEDPNSPNCVWVYEKGVEKPRRQPIPVTAAELDFYTPNPVPDGQAKDMIEREILGKIESNAAFIIKRWRTEKTPTMTEIEKERVALFIACLHTRSPMLRRDMDLLLSAMYREQAAAGADDDEALDKFIRENPDVKETRDQLRELVRVVRDPNRFSILINKNIVLAFTLNIMKETVPYFLERHWVFMRAPEGAEFITSDSPVSVFTMTAPGKALMNVGVGLMKSEVTFPVSPKLALRLTFGGSGASTRVSESTVAEANKRIAVQAERYLYSNRNTRRIVGLANRFAFTRSMPRVDPRAISARVRAMLRDKRPPNSIV